MFSFGIFTTHIPYIAFVVFYAYFLIFGVEKASRGELNTPENSIVSNHHAVQHVNLHNQANYFYQADNEFATHSYFEAFLFKRKIKYRINASAFFHQPEFYTTFSNRPPPCIG